MPTRPGLKQLAVLFLLTLGAVVVHGYHPYVEDAEIYVPGIKKILAPELYPRNAEFFASHAGLTVFPNLIAGSIRLTHLPLDWGLLLWHMFSIFLLLLACWRIGRLCFCDPLAPWGGVVMLASLLTIPVAGTALYILDQYLNTRSLSTPAVLFVAINTLERKFLRAGLWTALVAVIHPLMSVFGLAFAGILLWMGRRTDMRPAPVLLLLPLGPFPPVTEAYREVLQSHSYFFLLCWEWYEWVGIFAPLALLFWFQRIALRRALPMLDLVCRVLIIFELLFFTLGLAISVPSLANFAELQPMRSLHLLYVLLFTFAGGLLAQFVLKAQVWRWLVLFIPLCAGMGWVQRQLFPASSHIEWPGQEPRNPWAQAFSWIRQNTPTDAYFALDPQYMRVVGEDEQGFRAITERSRLADEVKDSGAVTMFPALGGTWQRQVRALSSWKTFQAADFQRLRQEFGVNWVVVEGDHGRGLTCPYQNVVARVCRIE